MIVGETDLKNLSPKLSAEWNHSKNGDLSPENISAHSNKKVWWKCQRGHEWEAVINSRYSGNHECPYCTGHRILNGYNDLATKHPELMAEWDFERNVSTDPSLAGSASKTKVWWKCKECGHEWETTIAVRTRGSSCPNCAKKKR